MKSGQLYSVLFVISSLASLSVISLCIWIVSRGSRGNTKDIVTTKSLYPGMPKVRPRGEITIWIGSMMAMLAIGLALGYGAAIREMNSNRYHYQDVMISRHSDTSYTLQPARMQPFEMTTCTPQNWKTGEKMKFIHFQWSPECDNVGERGDFEFYSEHGQRLIYREEVANAGD